MGAFFIFIFFNYKLYIRGKINLMLLIAESGSTKTQWSFVNKDRIEDLIRTPGVNPFNLSGNEIESILRPVSAGINPYRIQKIHFFGAGCSSAKNKEKMEKALLNVFGCKTIEVDTDLKAACLALAGDQSGIIALMGTGSNSCVWDGSKIVANTPSLGYVLGDEGGGVSIGRILLADYLKKIMPKQLRVKFEEKYSVTTEFALERVYQMQMPNRYLAGYAPFAEEFINDEYCYNLVYDQFNRFVERNLKLYNEINKLSVFFCGSIAFSHQDILVDICGKNNIEINKVIKSPITDLAQYFKNKF